MFDEPEESPTERSLDPAEQAREKADELRTHAELAAVFEGPKKFDAQIIPGLDAQIARDIQQTVARLEKSREAGTPLLPLASAADAAALLNLPAAGDLSTNDYHLHRRPGEVMMIRWLAGDEVDVFYDRLQAHFDAGLEGMREDERQAKEWKKDPQTQKYLEALDAVEIKMADRYLRDTIKKHNVFVLSTQSADEINIAFLCDYIMGIPAAELVGTASAPLEGASEADLAWFFKLFSLRGIIEGVERMCFFTFLQKSDDSGW
ncbi:MAG TPA: hypothetical protein VFE47_24985 [Tepidisphaeraceae bacterium]|jgi:hypothetical protein|nr:hypothetical protein [Tepidisphaeraceae bacterium]